jgi:hypothetical protein
MEIVQEKMIGVDRKAEASLKVVISKMLDLSEKILNKLRPIDPLNIVKKMTEEDIRVAKLEFAKALIQEYPEEFSQNDF